MENKESSVIFSLQELAALEDARIAEEKAEAEAQVEREAELEATRRAEHVQNLLLAEKNRRKEEAEAQARFEATIQGEVERARLEVEQSARMEALRAEHAHQEHLSYLAQDKAKKNLRYGMVGTSIGLVLVTLFFGGAWWSATVQRNNALAMVSAVRAEVARLTGELSARDAKIQRLERELDDARDELVMPGSSNDTSNPQVKKAQPGQRHGTGTGTPCKCPPGDPLCFCL